jgi:putative two-component system response regulator
MKKVLLVDDDKAYLEIASNVLKKEFEVITANSGKEALHLFYDGFVPDLILLDLMMPGIDGFDVFDRVRGIGKLHNTPIAFCSGTEDPENVKQANKLGAVDFIQKPCKDLTARVRRLL